MNSLSAVITDIKQIPPMNIIHLDCNSFSLKVVTLELNPVFQIGTSVNAMFKEIEVSLCSDIGALVSIDNKIRCVIDSINIGGYFADLSLSANNNVINVLTTTDSLVPLQVRKGDVITALIKRTDISLAEAS